MDNRKGLFALSILACMVVMTLFAEPALANYRNLGDRVWMDLNGDGIQNCEDTNNNGIIGDEGDTGEECLGAGIAGVTVDLVDCADQITVLDTTQTDASGFYKFYVLTPGEYCVRFEPDTMPDTVCAFGPPEFTTQNTGGDDAADSDADPITGMAAAVTLAYGETNLTVDAGIQCPAGPASLGDRVWMDLNGDGIQNCEDANNNGIIGDEGDSGEECVAAGVSGMTVNLVDCTDPNSVLGSTQTDASGFYLFDNLKPGEYCVRFELDTVPGSVCDFGSAEFTTQNAGSDNAADSDADPATGMAAAVTLAEGEINSTVDAGIRCPGPASLGDRVWMDLNGDGIQNCEDTNNNGIIGDEGDSGEECLDAGISGVTVDLVDCADPNTVLTSTQTDASGFYLFEYLSPGEYCVRFELDTVQESVCDSGSPEFTNQNTGSDDAADSDADPNTGVTTAVTLAEGETNLTVDAGVACSQPSPPCKFIVKRVSVDGGATFVDADQCTDELLAEDFGAIYEICVTNCGDKTLDLVKVSDPKLNFYKLIFKMEPGDQQCFIIDRPNICDDRDGGCPYWHQYHKNSCYPNDCFQNYNYLNTSLNNYGCNTQCAFDCHNPCDKKDEIINEATAKGYLKWCFWGYKLVVKDSDTACVVCKH